MAVQDWMEGKPVEKPWFLKGRDAVVWSRSYSHPDERACNCDMLQQTLEDVGARRMVVGHTIQAAGVNGACDNQVIRCGPLASRCRCPTWAAALSRLLCGAGPVLLQDIHRNFRQRMGLCWTHGVTPPVSAGVFA